MPPDKSKEKSWIFVPSGLRVGQVRKKGLLWKNRSGKKLFSSFEAAEKYRKQNKLKSTKTVPISSKDIPVLPYMERKPKPSMKEILTEAKKGPEHYLKWAEKSKSKPKVKAKPKIVEKYSQISEMDKKKIASLKASRDNLKKRREERDIYWAKKLKEEKEPDKKKWHRSALKKEKARISGEIDSLDNSIIRYKLNYSKVRTLVKKTLGERSKSHTTAIRGYRSYSKGHDIDPPSIYQPYIRISWNPGHFISGEREKKMNEDFKNKLKPVLKENGIKFTETSSEIIIGKKD